MRNWSKSNLAIIVPVVSVFVIGGAVALGSAQKSNSVNKSPKPTVASYKKPVVGSSSTVLGLSHSTQAKVEAQADPASASAVVASDSQTTQPAASSATWTKPVMPTPGPQPVPVYPEPTPTPTPEPIAVPPIIKYVPPIYDPIECPQGGGGHGPGYAQPMIVCKPILYLKQSQT